MDYYEEIDNAEYIQLLARVGLTLEESEQLGIRIYSVFPELQEIRELIPTFYYDC